MHYDNEVSVFVDGSNQEQNVLLLLHQNYQNIVASMVI